MRSAYNKFGMPTRMKELSFNDKKLQTENCLQNNYAHNDSCFFNAKNLPMSMPMPMSTFSPEDTTLLMVYNFMQYLKITHKNDNISHVFFVDTMKFLGEFQSKHQEDTNKNDLENNLHMKNLSK